MPASASMPAPTLMVKRGAEVRFAIPVQSGTFCRTHTHARVVETSTPIEAWPDQQAQSKDWGSYSCNGTSMVNVDWTCSMPAKALSDFKATVCQGRKEGAYPDHETRMAACTHGSGRKQAVRQETNLDCECLDGPQPCEGHRVQTGAVLCSARGTGEQTKRA